MSFLSFLSDVCDSIPVVGHIKGVVHDIAGDDAAARRSYVSATRSTMVVAGGAVGSLLGPAGAAAAAMYAGALTDTVASAVTNEPTGIIRNIQSLGDAEDVGDVFVGVGRLSLGLGLDAVSGVSFGAATKSIAQGGTKQLLKSGSKTALKLTAQGQAVKHGAVVVGTQMLNQNRKPTLYVQCSRSSSSSSSSGSGAPSAPDNDPSDDLDDVSTSSEDEEEKKINRLLKDAQLGGCIYAFIGEDGSIKIGMTNRHILTRLNEHKSKDKIKLNSYIMVYRLGGYVRWAETEIKNHVKIKPARLESAAGRLTENLDSRMISWEEVNDIIERVCGQTYKYERKDRYYHKTPKDEIKYIVLIKR